MKKYELRSRTAVAASRILGTWRSAKMHRDWREKSGWQPSKPKKFLNGYPLVKKKSWTLKISHFEWKPVLLITPICQGLCEFIPEGIRKSSCHTMSIPFCLGLKSHPKVVSFHWIVMSLIFSMVPPSKLHQGNQQAARKAFYRAYIVRHSRFSEK